MSLTYYCKVVVDVDMGSDSCCAFVPAVPSVLGTPVPPVAHPAVVVAAAAWRAFAVSFSAAGIGSAALVLQVAYLDQLA